MVDEQLFFLVTGILFTLIIALLIFILFNRNYLRQLDEQANNVNYNQDKLNTNTSLSFELNKNIIEYINSLEIIGGEDLNKLRTDLTTLMEQLHQDNANLIHDNTKAIRENEDKNSITRIKTRNNKNDIRDLYDKLRYLRKGVEFKMAKIQLKFIEEYEKKRGISENDKNMLVNTQLMGVYNELIYATMFDSNMEKPDIFIKDNKETLFNILDMLLNEFGISNYYGYSSHNDNYPIHKKLNNTNYGSDFPYIYTYIRDNHEYMELSETNIQFILGTYFPRLISYITNNSNIIYDTIDDMMIKHYEKIPNISTFFNEFLTSIELQTIVDDSNHLFTIIMKYILNNLYTESNWSDYVGNLLSSHKSRKLSHLLYILLPEYLIMMKYNIDYNEKYHKYIQSDYFLNINNIRLNSSNIVNFNKILQHFTCQDDKNENLRNDALKIFLSDKLSYMFTNKRYKFEQEFLPLYNQVVRTSTSVISTDKTFQFTDFVCDAQIVNEEEQ